MPTRIALDELDFAELVRPGDTVVWGQACGEPVTLVERLASQRHRIGRFKAFLGASFSQAVRPEHADVVSLSGFTGIGTARALVRAGVLDITPCHLSSVDRYLMDGRLPCDVALVQVARMRSGRYSYGVTSDYIQAAVKQARVVVAEVSDAVPATHCDPELAEGDLDILVETSRPPYELPRAEIGEVEARIARRAAGYVPERATLQVGIGAIPDAIMSELRTARGLGVHSGLIGDGVAELMERGAVTNEHKVVDRGVTVTGGLMGTRRLYDFASENSAIRMCPPGRTHAHDVLSRLERLASINSALEVDLTGQVNAESIGADYMGAVGGQIDFVRAAASSREGVSIIALPASAKAGAASRIVARLSGPVTTPRSDVGVVVTEYGAADLRGKTLRERARAMILLAPPDHREALEAAWRAQESGSRA